MNDNEKFITNTVLKISNKLKLTLEEKQELRGLLYECSTSQARIPLPQRAPARRWGRNCYFFMNFY